MTKKLSKINFTIKDKFILSGMSASGFVNNQLTNNPIDELGRITIRQGFITFDQNFKIKATMTINVDSSNESWSIIHIETEELVAIEEGENLVNALFTFLDINLLPYTISAQMEARANNDNQEYDCEIVGTMPSNIAM